MNEKNILLIAALGLGAFFLLTRKTAAAAAAPRRPVTPSAGAATQSQPPSQKTALIAGGLGLLSQIMGKAAPSAQQDIFDFAYKSYVPNGLDFAAVNVPMSAITYESAAESIDWGAQSNGFTSQW